MTVSGLNASSTTFTLKGTTNQWLAIPYFVVNLQSTSTYYWDRSGQYVQAHDVENTATSNNTQCFNIYPVTMSAPTGTNLRDNSVNYIPSTTAATTLSTGIIYAMKAANAAGYTSAFGNTLSVLGASPGYYDFFQLQKSIVGTSTLSESSENTSFLIETADGLFFPDITSADDNASVTVTSDGSAAGRYGIYSTSTSGEFYIYGDENNSNVGLKNGYSVLGDMSGWRDSDSQGHWSFYPVETEAATALFADGSKTWEVATTATTTLKEGYYVVQNVNNSYYISDNTAGSNLAFSAGNTAKENIVQVISSGTAGHYYIKSYSGHYFSPLVNALEATKTGIRTDYEITATSTDGEFYIVNNSLYMSRAGTSYPRGVTETWKDNASEGHWKFFPVDFVNVPVDAATEYTVRVRNATGKEYNGIYDNRTRWYTNWYCTVSEPYDLYTMTLQATYNNLAFRHFYETTNTEYADGSFLAAYGITHDAITLTAPDGWYIKSVTMNGTTMGSNYNYIAATQFNTGATYQTATWNSETGAYEASGTDKVTGSAGSGSQNVSDFVCHEHKTIDNCVKVFAKDGSTYTETGAADFLLNGSAYCYLFAPSGTDSYVNTANVATAMASDSVKTYTLDLSSSRPTSWRFHVNGYNNSPLLMTMDVTLVKCDEVAGIIIEVQDEDGTVLASSLKRNVRFGPNNEVYVPYDLRRDYFTAIIQEDRATIEANGTATVKYTNGNLPFRKAANATDKDNMYYMGFGPSNAPRFLSYTADETALPFDNETDDVESEWFGFMGNPYDGYQIVNYKAGADKYLTTTTPADGVQPTMVADGSYNNTIQRRRWYPQRAVNTHSDGKKYGASYGTTLPATAATHFYLAPIKDNGESFADCDVTWHYNRLGNCTESALTYQMGRDGANSKAAVSIYEIRDHDLRLINSEYPNYENGKVEVTLKDVRELQTLKLQDSHLARDFTVIAGTITGDENHHTVANGYTREEYNYTNQLFRVSPDPANPIYYGMAIKYNDWHYLKYDSSKDYIPVESTSDADAAAFINNDAAKWFFQGNPWNGFQIFTIGAGSTKTLVTADPSTTANTGADVSVQFKETSQIASGTESNSFLFHKAIKTTVSPATYFANYDTDYAPFNLTPAAFNTYYTADTKNGYDSEDTRGHFQLNYRADFAEGPGIAYWTAYADEGSAFILKPITELKYVYNLWDDAYSTTVPRYTTTIRVLHGLTKTLDFRNVDGVNWIRDFCNYTRTQDYDYDGNDISGTSTSIKMWTRDLPNNLSVAQAAALRALNANNEAVITRDIRYNFTLFQTAADITDPQEEELYYLAVRPQAYGETGVDDANAHTVLHYEGAGANVTAPQTITEGGNTYNNYKGGGFSSQKWFFSGNPYDGFRIMNLEGTSTYSLAAGTSHTGNASMQTYDANDTEHTFLWRPDSCYISGSNYLGGENTYGYRFHNRNCFNLYAEAYDGYRESTGNCLNRVNHTVAFWTGNDIGSRFFVVPVATDQSYTYNIVDEEGNIVLVDGSPLTTTVTVVQGETKTYSLATDYNMQRDFCTYTLDGEPVDITQEITHSNPNGEGLKETFNIQYHWNGPFELSTSSDPVWYLLKLKSTGSTSADEIATGSESGRNYVIYDATRTAETDAQGFKTQAGWNDELNIDNNYVIKYIYDGTGLWAFEGDPYSNFKLVNYYGKKLASTPAPYLTATNVDNNATYSPILTASSPILWEIGQNAYNGIQTGFYIRAIGIGGGSNATDYLNKRGSNLSYWQSASAASDHGSQFFVEEMTPYVLTYMGRYINAPENTFYGLQPSVQRNFAENYNSFATIGQANAEFTYAEAADGLVTTTRYIKDVTKTQPHDGAFRLLFKEKNVYAHLANGSTYKASTSADYVPGSSTTALLYGNISANSTDALVRNLTSVACFTKGTEDTTLGTVNGTLTVQGMKSPSTLSASNPVLMNSETTGEVRLFTTPFAPYTFISTNPTETSLSGFTFYHRNNQNYVVSWEANAAASILYVIPATEIQVKAREAADGRLYTTLYLPYPVTLSGSNASAYYISDALSVSSDGSYAVAPTVAIKNVPAGTAVVLATSEPDVTTTDEAFIHMDIPSAAVATTYSSIPATNILTGTYMPTTSESVTGGFAADEKLYVFSQGKTFAGKTEAGFFPYSGSTLNANRIFLVYDHVAQKNAGASAPQAIVFDIDDAAIDVAISSAGYSTLYYDLPLIVPEGVEAATVSVIDDQLTIDYCYPAGSVIPAETGVLLKGEAGHYIFQLTDEDGTSYAGNMLRGSTTDQLTDDGGAAYKLSVGEDGLPGFYLGDPDGGRFINTAYKAYLFVPNGSDVRGFNFDDAISTGVGSGSLTDGQGNGLNGTPTYDTQGRRVGKKVMPGVYIVNGKKVFVK